MARGIVVVAIIVVLASSCSVHAQECLPFPSIMCLGANAWNISWAGSPEQIKDGIERNIRADYTNQAARYLSQVGSFNNYDHVDECLLVIRDVVCAVQVPRCFIYEENGPPLVLERPICKDLCLAFQRCFSRDSSLQKSDECHTWEDTSDDPDTCSGNYVNWKVKTSGSATTYPRLPISFLCLVAGFLYLVIGATHDVF